MKKKLLIIPIVVLSIFLFANWLLWGPNSWEVQISGTTGDGQNIQYRIETIYAGTSKSLIFRNEDARFWPPYFKFDSADLQARANRIKEQCPEVPVTINGYSFRLPFLDMFPNATSIDAPERCIQATTRAPGSAPEPLPPDPGQSE
ncbi:DUF1523 family protein [Ectothiorhodospira sp. BSL-9]|uniref:DUF1523 family protein n=1 Tax=Ectothiorhodospira sp. BSL-9 TaxID=1442136 RepID=UPI0007B4457F|nr:DUF1523 family protein [Ectothiorhodospira sp. BSL-9]ANB02360.1 hypothetical protein ECTOBSL9_1730 [Ectothiorhodospira sp. BSL-9]